MPRKGEVIDLTGQRFGRLVATSIAGTKHRHAVWECACDCGATIKTTRGMLVSGSTTSCGCVHREQLADRNRRNAKHGLSSGRTYSSWRSMRARARGSSSAQDRKNYFDKGVTVCERWESFENFLADMGERPVGKTIDRFPNPEGNYEPSNCRWATPSEQRHNLRPGARIGRSKGAKDKGPRQPRLKI